MIVFSPLRMAESHIVVTCAKLPVPAKTHTMLMSRVLNIQRFLLESFISFSVLGYSENLKIMIVLDGQPLDEAQQADSDS